MRGGGRFDCRVQQGPDTTLLSCVGTTSSATRHGLEEESFAQGLLEAVSEALVHGSELSTEPPLTRPYSPHVEAVGHPEAGHGVQDLAREADLDPLATEGSAPHPLTEDALVPEHGVLHQTPPTIA